MRSRSHSQETSMSKIPNTKMLSKLGGRRKRNAFLIVAAATFFCLSIIWPLSTKAWRSESEISLSLMQRRDSAVEFQKLLNEVVPRHTSIESIVRVIEQNGMDNEGGNISRTEMASNIHQRLKIVLLDENVDPDQLAVRVGLDGWGSEKEKFFVNVMATMIAKDFMTSPLAGILPTDPLPIEDIESLRQRHREIEQRANELLAQIQDNLRDSATDLVNSSSDSPTLVQNDARLQTQLSDELESLSTQRERIASAEGDSILELAAIDQQIEDVQVEFDKTTENGGSSPFHMASHTLNRVATGSSLKVSFESLRETIGDLANVAAESYAAAETAARTRPAFSIQSVRGKSAVPVGAIPSWRELLFLTLASVVFATIVSLAYQPFAEQGFESVEQVGKKLNLPVIATLQSRNKFEDITGPGIPAESVKAETPGSNQVVNICKWILFCSLMLTIGFCLVNANIRNSFMDGPFQGFAQIFWTLKGN